jgi:UDP-N-acetylglucosamine--N-acetylmuramyl-(pentapeptide) pyrophosphoryl-undecaprenol N-acetylglucosamine transferase
MKILITGGHLTPALAIIEKLKKEDVFYVSRKYTFEGEKAVSLEYQQIEKLGIPFFELRTGRLQRKITKHTLISLFKLPPGFLRAYKIIKQVKPDIVLTFGSYISVPVGIVAKLMGISLVIHEQTLEAGLANRILSKFADKICISFESSEKYFPKAKCILTGNPIREAVTRQKNTKPEKNLLYISGGSGGSHVINVLVEQVLEKLLHMFTIIHQTGDSKQYNDFDRLSQLKKSLGQDLADRYEVIKFLDADLAASTMARASFIIGRSGINTVTELIFLNKPALLIPLSFSQKNEQLKNAQFLQKLGLAKICVQEGLTADKFYENILDIFTDLKNFKLEQSILIPDSSEKILEVLTSVCKKKAD